MKKNNILLKIIRWFLLGNGYICYLVYIILRYICYSVGFTSVTLFKFIFDVITFKHIRSLIKKDNSKKTKEKKVEINIFIQKEKSLY